MKRLLLFLLLFSLNSFGAEPIKIVVLDTGFKANAKYKIPLCKNYHYDATNSQAKASNIPPMDIHGHGTHIVGVINQFAQNLPLTKVFPMSMNVENLEKIKNVNPTGYCFVIVKYYNNSIQGEEGWAKSLNYIETIPGKLIINISGGGSDPINREKEFVKRTLKKGNKIISAIGNDKQKGSYYPASEYGVTAVGAMEVTFFERKSQEEILISKIYINKMPVFVYKSKYSNYGHSKIIWRFGHLYSGGLNDDIVLMRGTSQATAMQTGLEINKLLQNKEK
jgi:hypothetical protein